MSGTHFNTTVIRQSADRVNDACNQWSDSSVTIDGAWLPQYALGVVGESARLHYEVLRGECIQKLFDSTNALINTREALVTVADEYDGKESSSADGFRDAHEGLRHRPDI